MKLFFASDLHGSLPATEKTIEKFVKSDADQLLLLGDILNHGPRNPIPEGYQPAKVAELLNQYSNKIMAVRGNCDSEVDQMLLAFPMMESNAWVLVENGRRIFLTHGHKYNKDNVPPLANGDIIAHGHSHLPCAERINDFIFFNPGSVTFPKGGFVPSYGLYSKGKFEVLSFEGEVLSALTL